MIHVGQQIAKAVKTLNNVPRVAFLFTGGDVPHTHAHIVPMHEGSDITSRRYIAEEQLTFRAVEEAPFAELSHIADALRMLLKV